MKSGLGVIIISLALEFVILVTALITIYKRSEFTNHHLRKTKKSHKGRKYFGLIVDLIIASLAIAALFFIGSFEQLSILYSALILSWVMMLNMSSPKKAPRTNR